MAGTALGMLILPQLVRVLLEAYEFQGAVLVLSGLALHAAAGSMLLQPIKGHLKEVPIDVELAAVSSNSGSGSTNGTNSSANGAVAPPPPPQQQPLQHFPEEEGMLPEMTNLLRFDANKKMRKNFSELAISSMNRPSRNLRMPRNLSVVATTQAAMSGGGLMPAGADMTTAAVRRRRASVMSHLSLLDFSGSNVHVHMNVSVPALCLPT